MGKITQFSIITSLGKNQAYIAGSLVEGKVIIDLKKPKAINGPIRIVLSGKARVWLGARVGLPPTISNTHQTRSALQTIFDDMTVNLWSTSMGSAENLKLSAGKHEFPFTFQLPTDIPSSYEDGFGYIRYVLIAAMPTSKLEFTRQKVFQVHEVVRIDTPELINELSDSSQKILCCLWCASALTLSVTIDKGGYASGEKIVIKESHGYRRITNACAILRRKTTYHFTGSGESNFNYKHIVTTSFNQDADTPNTKIGFLFIPPGTTPSINSSILKVSYLVTVTLKFQLPMVNNLTVSIPIIIGNGRQLTTGGGIASSAPVYPISNALQSTSIQPSAAPMPSAPPRPMLDTLEQTPMQPVPNTYSGLSNIPLQPMSTTIMPSAPPRPILNTLQSVPTETNINGSEVPQSPPPAYSAEYEIYPSAAINFQSYRDTFHAETSEYPEKLYDFTDDED